MSAPLPDTALGMVAHVLLRLASTLPPGVGEAATLALVPRLAAQRYDRIAAVWAADLAELLRLDGREREADAVLARLAARGAAGDALAAVEWVNALSALGPCAAVH
jgi:hypothetical protein